jgi:hypothetical protein
MRLCCAKLPKPADASQGFPVIQKTKPMVAVLAMMQVFIACFSRA